MKNVSFVIGRLEYALRHIDVVDPSISANSKLGDYSVPLHILHRLEIAKDELKSTIAMLSAQVDPTREADDAE